MNRRPDFPAGPSDGIDPDLAPVAEELERYAAAERGEPPIDLASRIRAAVDAAPEPGAGWRVSLAALLRAWRAPARGLAIAAVLVVAVVGALAVGQLIDQARQPNIGTSPSPAIVSPTPSASPTPVPSASPSPSPSPSPTQTPSPTATPTPPAPSASDDSDESETPEPSGSDNSGPGGGGDDNSGPGGGDN